MIVDLDALRDYVGHDVYIVREDNGAGIPGPVEFGRVAVVGEVAKVHSKCGCVTVIHRNQKWWAFSSERAARFHHKKVCEEWYSARCSDMARRVRRECGIVIDGKLRG